jgi:anti-anti-sigma factor
MQILTHVQQNSYIIALSGTLDVEATPSVQNAMLEALQYGPKDVMVDCEELEGITPNSLKSFISTIRNLQRNQVGLVLLGVNEGVNKLFSGIGADSFMKQVTSSSLISSENQYDIYFQKI